MNHVIVTLFACKGSEQYEQVHDALIDLEKLHGNKQLQFAEINVNKLPKLCIKYDVIMNIDE